MSVFKKQRRFTVLCIAAMASCLRLSAQTGEDTLLHLPEVVITENYRNRAIRSTLPMQILTEKAIQNLNALQISDVVKHFSGVTVKDYGGIGGLKTVSVRGLGASHTAVGYNGVLLSDVQTGQIDIGRFSTDNVNSITLNQAQSDQIFQPARFFSAASVLHIHSRIPSFEQGDNTHGKVSLKTGSFGLINPAFYLEQKIGDRLAASFSGEWLSADGKYPYVLHYGPSKNDSTSVEKRKNTDVQHLRLEGAAYGKISQTSRANVRLYYYRSERGLPGATIFYNTDNASKQRLWDKTFFAQAHYRNDFSETWAIQANAKYNYGYQHYLDPTYLNSAGKLENFYRQHEGYGSVALLYNPYPALQVSAATDLTSATLDANLYNFVYPRRITLQSVMAAKFVSEKITATANVLYTQTDEKAKNGDAAENHRKVSPCIALAVRPFDDIDLHFRTFYKNIFRLPTFNDLYYSLVGKRDLKPEDAQQVNFGLTYGISGAKALSFLSFTADAYRNTIKNKIVAVPVKNMFEWSMVNYGKVRIDGIDLSLESIFKLPHTMSLSAGGTFSYQKALNMTDPQSSTYKNQIPYTPRTSGAAHATVEMPWFNVSYTLLWSGIRYALAENIPQNRLPGYTDHSFLLSKVVNTKRHTWHISVEALNVADKNYEIVRNFPMPGRSFRGTVSIDF
ncbi:MAG: TonB-dependent receptor [Dysgonamonadaceae bacterium]|nr:TonB-dependent receptor [Dysgonamonadaceae bacterium]